MTCAEILLFSILLFLFGILWTLEDIRFYLKKIWEAKNGKQGP